MKPLKSLLVWTILWVTCGIATSAAAEEPPECVIEAVPGGIACVADHPSLYAGPARFREGRHGNLPAGPVALDDHLYYALGADLITLDATALVVVARHRLPAPIVDLELTDDGELRAQILTRDFPTPTALTFDPRRDFPTGAPWDWSATLGAFQDALWLPDTSLAHEPGASEAPPEIDEEAHRRLIETLTERRAFDPTNAFLPILEAEARERLGQTDEARRAYQAAATAPAPFLDLLRIAFRLEYRGHPDIAAVAFDNARQARDDAGVTPANITSMVNASLGALWFQDAARKALSAGDLEALDRIQRHFADFFPHVEGSLPAARQLQRLLEDPDVRRYWAARADELADAPGPDHAFHRAASRFDLYLVLQGALALTLLLSGLLLGLGRRRDDEDPARLKPSFAAADLIPLILLLVAIALLPRLLTEPVQTMITWADAPTSVTGDALDAPASQAWLETLTPSPARDALLTEPPTPYTTVLATAISAHSAEHHTDPSPGLLTDFPWLGHARTLARGAPPLVLLVLLLNALFFGALLQAVCRRVPRLQALGRRFVIGAPTTLGVLRIPTLFLFLLGLIALTPIRDLNRLATDAALTPYFGLTALPEASSILPGLAIVVTALIIHGVAASREDA